MLPACERRRGRLPDLLQDRGGRGLPAACALLAARDLPAARDLVAARDLLGRRLRIKVGGGGRHHHLGGGGLGAQGLAVAARDERSSSSRHSRGAVCGPAHPCPAPLGKRHGWMET